MRDITPFRHKSKSGSPIKARYAELVAIREKANAAIVELRKQCSHIHTEGIYKASTGNWCPQDDSYWIDAKCLDCGQTWHIDSEEQRDEYRHFKGVIKVDTRR